MPKIQIYQSDLASLLKCGRINDMFVATENGQLVLRIDCTAEPAKQASEYKTIGKKQTTKKKPGRITDEDTLAGKVADKFGDWWANKEPPAWMK